MAFSAPSNADLTAPANSGRSELAFLDGIRGSAALSVVILHAFLFTGATGEAKTAFPMLGHLVGLGYLGVPVFIVLSGYVLMLPVIRHHDFRMARGTKSFLMRRAKRILPPYFAALAITLVLIRSIPVMQQPSGTQWDTKIPVTTADVVSHLFLVHDFSADWIGKINGPLWSVAIEWHIYFLMPFVLLPLWRRVHPLVIVAVLATVSLGLASVGVVAWLHPWFVPLFAVGMAAAEYSTRRGRIHARTGLVVASVLLVAPPVLAIVTRQSVASAWVTEVMAGVVIGTFLAWAGRRAVMGRPTKAARFFEIRPLARLGLISYSLYLLHSPLLGLGNLLFLPWGLSISAQLAMMYLVVTPLAVLICWLFFRLVEAHFLNSHQRNVTRNAVHQML